MIPYALIFYLLIKIQAPAWAFVLCSIGLVLKAIDIGANLQKKAQGTKE